jgi:hypothetical protein
MAEHLQIHAGCACLELPRDVRGVTSQHEEPEQPRDQKQRDEGHHNVNSPLPRPLWFGQVKHA